MSDSAQPLLESLIKTDLSVLSRNELEAYIHSLVKLLTEQHQIEELSATEKAMFHSFLRTSADQIYRFRIKENCYDFVSPSVTKLWGISVEEAMNDPRSFTQRMTPEEDWVKVWEVIKEHHAIPLNPEPVEVEYRVRRDDGTEIWVSDIKNYEYDEDGTPVIINGIVRDITAQKKIESELREALASVKQLTGLLPICAACKKIRDDSGYWSQVEAYLESHTGVTFTHGICPDCMSKYDEELEQLRLITAEGE